MHQPRSAAGGWAAVEAAVERAAWFGDPRAGAAALAGADPDGAVPERVRWLAGVCLGAVGRYRAAARWLAPGGQPAGSLAASCLASHLRQLGRHAEAEPLDRLALGTAADAGARADALTGLVADAVGRRELLLARARLDPATVEVVAVTTGDAVWRARVRLAWVTAETALLAGEPEPAIDVARNAVRISRMATACRHTVKSELVLGVALESAGRVRPAARVLRTAASGADRLGLLPLLPPACSVLARILEVHAPATAERERVRARTAQRISQEAADSLTIG